MAKKSKIAKAKRVPKFKVRQHNRCHFCGRLALATFLFLAITRLVAGALFPAPLISSEGYAQQLQHA